jgi:transposase
MAPSNAKSEVHLNPEQRRRTEDLVRNGHAPAKKILHAHILLLCDRDHPQGRRTDWQVAEILHSSEGTVRRVRRTFARSGEGPALDRKPRATPPTPPKLDGRAEAHLVALCCAPPPEGRARWTLKLLARELGRLEVVTSVCPETVRRALKKMRSSPGAPSGPASRSRTGPGSSPRWSKCWTSTPPPTPRRGR